MSGLAISPPQAVRGRSGGYSDAQCSELLARKVLASISRLSQEYDYEIALACCSETVAFLRLIAHVGL